MEFGPLIDLNSYGYNFNYLVCSFGLWKTMVMALCSAERCCSAVSQESEPCFIVKYLHQKNFQIINDYSNFSSDFIVQQFFSQRSEREETFSRLEETKDELSSSI